MLTIYKYSLRLDRDCTVYHLPVGYKVLTAMVQGSVVFLWIEHDISQPKQAVKFEVFGTGFNMPIRPREHVGSVQQENFVWHIYKCIEE